MPKLVGTPTIAGAVPQTSPLTFSYTVPDTGARRCLIVTIQAFDTTGTISGVTYNGVAMTFVGRVDTTTGNGAIEIWRLVNPSVGANNVSITTSATMDEMFAQAHSYVDVNQTSPTGTIQTLANGTRTTSTIPTLSFGGGDIGIGSIYCGGGVITLTESDTLISETDGAGVSVRGVQYGDHNLSWTHSSSTTEAIGVPLRHDGGLQTIVRWFNPGRGPGLARRFPPFKQGIATAAAAPSNDMEATGSLSISGVADLAATGSLLAAGSVVITASAILSGAGNLSAAGALVINGLADIDAAGNLLAVGTVVINGSAMLNATGNMLAVGSVVINGLADLTSPAGNDIAASGSLVIAGAAALTALGNMAALGTLWILGAGGGADLVDGNAGPAGGGDDWIIRARRRLRR